MSVLVEFWDGIRKEEQVWRQKSRVNWLKDGDRNTKLFHMEADGRRRGNHISDLVLEGEVTHDPSSIK